MSILPRFLPRFVATSLAAASFLVVGSASAVEVDFFHSPSDDGTSGGILELAPSAGQVTINLWADPRVAAGASTFGIQDVILEAIGSISVVSFTCDGGADCIAGVSSRADREAFFTGGDDTNGDFAPFPIATIVLEVASGLGEFKLISGTALAGDFSSGDLTDQTVVATVVPEPGAATLIGLGLMALARGRRAS